MAPLPKDYRQNSQGLLIGESPRTAILGEQANAVDATGTRKRQNLGDSVGSELLETALLL